MPAFPIRLATITVCLALLAGCSVPDVPTEIHDPYEASNRKVHEFNTKLDRAIVRPLAQAYGKGVPKRARKGVTNIADYLSTPRYVANNLAQGNIEDAGHNFFRFLVNTVFGFGLLDPATEAGLERRPTGFGETLAVWGAPEGAYIVSPVLGPKTERDAAGAIVDIVTNPVGLVLQPSSRWIAPASSVGSALNTRLEFGSALDDLLDNSADSYVQTRNLYLQNRRFELGQEDDFAFDPYKDF